MADLPETDDGASFPLRLRGTGPDDEEAHIVVREPAPATLATEAAPCYDYAFVAGVGTAILWACTVT